MAGQFHLTENNLYTVIYPRWRPASRNMHIPKLILVRMLTLSASIALILPANQLRLLSSAALVAVIVNHISCINKRRPVNMKNTFK